MVVDSRFIVQRQTEGGHFGLWGGEPVKQAAPGSQKSAVVEERSTSTQRKKENGLCYLVKETFQILKKGISFTVVIV